MPTLFVVDDEPAIQRIVSLMFESAGWSVLTYYDAETALDNVGLGRPDAVLIDVRLPGIRGDAAVERIRLSPAYANVFVVLMSAEREPPVHLADAFRSKPFDIDELVELVDSNVARRHSREASCG